MRSVCYIALSLLASTSLLADTLYLADGRTLNGTYQGGTSREIQFRVNGGATQRFSLNSVRNLVLGETQYSSSTNSSEGSRSRSDNAIPSGTVITVRMIDPVNSNATNVGDTYRASLDEPLVFEGRTIAPAGSDALVQVVRVNQGSGIAGKEEISLALSEIRSNGQVLRPVTTNAQVASKSRGSQTAKVVGGTAVVGAIIGAIAGGGKGAAIGAASGAGAGAAVQAIRGQRIEIPSEAKLDFSLAEPMPVN